jgi:hypothetical protein
MKTITEEKRCGRCHLLLGVDFYQDSPMPDGRRFDLCPPCHGSMFPVIKSRADAVAAFGEGSELVEVVAAKLADQVNHPAHYTRGGIEAIDVIEAWDLGFCLGNTVKYIARAGHKGDALEDLRKARWYLDREIARREGSRS